MNQNKIPTSVNLFATSDSSHHPTTNSISMLGLAAVVCCIMNNKRRTERPKPSQLVPLQWNEDPLWRLRDFLAKIASKMPQRESSRNFKTFNHCMLLLVRQTDWRRDQRHRSSVVRRQCGGCVVFLTKIYLLKICQEKRKLINSYVKWFNH